ncbi:MAG: putative dicarboxylate transporter small rane protein [Deltaproteobacteria bacterium]|jgi:TRAP-type C4-dicarboxylate transport system permease small subunit|nr:putative dicarboxylate transporter small rane protein [Deltaproteobacteria bacterium]
MEEKDMNSFSRVRRLNHFAAIISGVMIVIISLLCFLETIARNLFSQPTSWTLDISTYFLIWAFFLGSAAAFQEKTHVSVDFFRDMIARSFGRIWGRILAIAGYLFSLGYILVLLVGTIYLIKDALNLKKLTLAVIQIPVVYLYLAMLLGSFLMIVVVIFIILDLLNKKDQYL